jgi:hypothetical protein
LEDLGIRPLVVLRTLGFGSSGVDVSAGSSVYMEPCKSSAADGRLEVIYLSLPLVLWFMLS